MAKTLVVDESEGTRVPFLRGILTRSLHDAGLDFEDAYKLASEIRQDLNEVVEISSEALRDIVIAKLEENASEEVLESYQLAGRLPSPIMIRDVDGQVTPFSQTEHIHCLESCGLSPKHAEESTAHIYQHLIENEPSEISSSRLGHLTYICLNEHFGQKVAKRYMVWVDYLHSGRPLILLIGGTSGCGKSTTATEVAHRLDIVRTQSTDMLREVMRMLIPERLLPVLHTSSFNAWKSLPEEYSRETDQEQLIATGYRSQMELLSLPCEAVIQRALKERVSIILEGVHVHPYLVEHIEEKQDVVVVPVMLAVLKREKLKKRLMGRGKQVPERSSQHYLSNFDRIWQLQSFLLSEADRNRVQIIANNDKEKTTNQIMSTIIDVLEAQFDSTPAKVFDHG